MSKRSSHRNVPADAGRIPRTSVGRGGFTLLELLMAAAILGILLGGLTQVLTRTLDTRRSETQRIDLQQYANLKAEHELRAFSLRGEGLPRRAAATATRSPW